MNISKLSPIGYKEKTAKGNEYKRSNVGKTSAILTSTAVGSFIYHLQDKKYCEIVEVRDYVTLGELFEAFVKYCQSAIEDPKNHKNSQQHFIDSRIKLNAKNKTMKVPKPGYLKGMLGGLAISIITFLCLFALGKNYDDYKKTG